MVRVTLDPLDPAAEVVGSIGALAEAFEEFHEDNPHVYECLVELARQWVEVTGRRRVGVAMLLERARWEIAIRTNDPDYKINDHHAAFYARLIMWHEPDLGGLFALRVSEADEWLRIRTSQLPE